MYGRATLSFYAYDMEGIRGVDCVLGNILKTRNGERTYTPDYFARVGAAFARDCVRNEQGAVVDQLLAHLRKFKVKTVQQLKPEQYGAFADGLRALGAQV